MLSPGALSGRRDRAGAAARLQADPWVLTCYFLAMGSPGGPLSHESSHWRRWDGCQQHGSGLPCPV